MQHTSYATAEGDGLHMPLQKHMKAAKMGNLIDSTGTQKYVMLKTEVSG